MKLKAVNSLAALMAICAALTACGGGGGGGTTAAPLVAGTDIPVSATETTMGVVSFANLTAANSDDTAEPLVAGDAALASSETDEPDASV